MGVVLPGPNESFVNDGGSTRIYSRISHQPYDISVSGNVVSTGRSKITLCDPDCVKQTQLGLETITLEKTDLGVRVSWTPGRFQRMW